MNIVDITALGKLSTTSNITCYNFAPDQGYHTVKNRGNFFQCRVFAMKSVQNRKSFWRTSQNCFVLALFYIAYTQLATFLNAFAS